MEDKETRKPVENVKVYVKSMERVLLLLDMKNPECAYCGQKLKATEIGGMWNNNGSIKVFCKDEFCIIQYCLEEDNKNE